MDPIKPWAPPENIARQMIAAGEAEQRLEAKLERMKKFPGVESVERIHDEFVFTVNSSFDKAAFDKAMEDSDET